MAEKPVSPEQQRAQRIERVDIFIAALIHEDNLMVGQVTENWALQEQLGISAEEATRRQQMSPSIPADVPSLATISPMAQDLVITKLRELVESMFGTGESTGRRETASRREALISYYALNEDYDYTNLPTQAAVGKSIGTDKDKGVTKNRVRQYLYIATAEIGNAMLQNQDIAARWQEIKNLLNPPTTGIEAPQTPPAE